MDPEIVNAISSVPAELLTYVLIVETEINSRRTQFVPTLYTSKDKQKLLTLMDSMFHVALINAASSEKVSNLTYEFSRESDTASISYNENHKLYDIHYTITTSIDAM